MSSCADRTRIATSTSASQRSRCFSSARTSSTSSMPSTSSMLSTSSITSVVSSSVLDEATTIKCDDPRVTVMMKNIPIEYSREQLLEIMDAAGFQKYYNAVYVPADLKSEEVLGYAFINFTTHEQAEKFIAHFNDFTDWQVPSDQVCEVKWSGTLQGYNATIERYRNSPMMHESVPDN